MSRLLAVARTHVRLGMSQSGTVFAASALLLVTLTSAWLNWQRSSLEATARFETQERARAQWEQQGSKDPHSAAHFGIYAVKPVSAWAWFDPGVDPYLGTAIFMEAHKQDTPTGSRVERSEWQRLLTVPTPAAILQLLLPLLAILCGFAAFAEDRETGVLRQTLSTGLQPLLLGAGKLLGCATVLVSLTAPMFGGVLLMAWYAGAPMGSGMALVASYGAYALTFLMISVAVSARSTTSQSALTLLLSLWLAVCILLPRMAADGAAHTVPVPTFAAFWQQVADDQAHGVDGHDDRNARTEALRRQVLEQYGVDRVEDLPISFRGLALQAGEEYGNQVFDRRYGELWDAYRKQEGVQFALSLASPLLALRNVSLSLAGTGMNEYRSFADAAETYRRKMVRMLNNEVAAARPHSNASRDATFWRKVPEFRYTATVGGVGSSRSALACWFFASMLLVTLAFRGLRP